MKYSAWSNDKENLFNSSSGGIFLELAKKMLSKNGKVVGVIMDGVKAKYIISNDLEEIKKMRGSKYIPSNPSQVIKEIKDSKEKILFTGLSCHIEAVKNSCDTNNMILCDLICHGLPKDGIFEGHVEKISKGRNILSIKFRDKRAGWELGKSLIITFSNGETYDCYDDYMKEYMGGKILRTSCKTCKKRNIGDITIGDFWGVPSSLRNNMGTSIVTVNTKKGKDFFNSINTIIKKPVRFYHIFSMDVFKNVIYHSLTKSGAFKVFKRIYYGKQRI